MYVRDGQRLRTLALVLDLGSISAAADVLGYTQSAVSQQLAALEREIGVALVDRSQRPLRATPAGATLRPHVDRVLGALGAADSVVEDLRGGVTRLRLAAFPSALASFVPAAVRDLRRTTAASSCRCSSSRPRRRSSGCAAVGRTSLWCITSRASRSPRRAA